MKLRKRLARLGGQAQDLVAEVDRRVRTTRDVAVISYPKSGRTWLRFMLNTAGLRLRYDHAGSGNRLALPFEAISDRPEAWLDWRIILLVRDPRDTAVSCYFQATRRVKDELRYRGDMSAFIRDPRYGIEKIARFNLLWSEAASRFRDFASLSYEDLHQDTAGELQRVTSYALRRPVAPEKLRQAMEAGRFNNMRRLEEAAGRRMHRGLRLGGGEPGNQDSYKTRRGSVGGWSEYFSAEDIQLAERVLAELDYWNRLEAARAVAAGARQEWAVDERGAVRGAGDAQVGHYPGERVAAQVGHLDDRRGGAAWL